MNTPFTLSKSNKTYFAIVAVLSIVLFFVFSGKSATQFGELVGKLIAFYAIPAIIAWFVWFLRGKKENAGRMTFNLVLTLALAGQVVQFSEGINKDVDLDKARQEMLAQKEVFKNAAANDEEISDTAYDNYTSAVKDGFNKLADGADTGSEKQFYELLSSFVEETETLVKSWRDSFSAVQAERILDFSRLKEAAEIEYQKNTLNHYIERSESYGDYFSNMVQIMEEKLSPLGEGNSHARGALAGAEIKHQAQKPIFEPLMVTHIEYGKVMIEMIAFLEKNNNGWSYENEEMIFSKDSLLVNFNQIIEAMVEKEEIINSLTSKLVKTL